MKSQEICWNFACVTFAQCCKPDLYNNEINAHALIAQSAMVYCAGKLMEKLHVFRVIIWKQ